VHQWRERRKHKTPLLKGSQTLFPRFRVSVNPQNLFKNLKFLKMKNLIKDPSDLSLKTVAKAWCQEKTSGIIFDPDLAVEFARILDDIWAKPWLGNATTKELLDELGARCGNLNYKTVDENE
jgi:hypothetical protein